jgi:hypothetical protein
MTDRECDEWAVEQSDLVFLVGATGFEPVTPRL